MKDQKETKPDAAAEETKKENQPLSKEEQKKANKEANSIRKRTTKLYKKFYKSQIIVLKLRHEMTILESETAQAEVKRHQARSYMASMTSKELAKETDDSDSPKLKDEM